MKQQIFITPQGVGLTHMLASTNYGILLSENLNKRGIECEVFHDCKAWECFHEMFDVKHKNFSTKKATTPFDSIDVRELNIDTLTCPTTPIKITADSTKSVHHEQDFFETFKLNHICFHMFKQAYKTLDNGNYTTIHVRGGDMIRNKFDNNYKSFISYHQERISKIIENVPLNLKILLISDNQEILFKNVDNKRVFTTSIALELYNKNVIFPETLAMHSANKSYTKGIASVFDICFNAVLDLFLMAHGKEIHPDTKNSGYAQCGKGLFDLLQKHSYKRII